MAQAKTIEHDTDEAGTDLQPGLMKAVGPDDDAVLLGCSCADCGARFFPARARCVSCYGGNIRTVDLERVGKVDSFTIVRQAPPGYHGPVPYVLGMVVLGNDVHVLAHLTGRNVDDWHRGDSVAAQVMTLPVGPDRTPRRSFAFRPAQKHDLNAL